MSRPRALLVAPLAPELTGNGLAMRLGLFLEALHHVAETDLLVLQIAGHGVEGSGLASSLGIPATTITVAGQADTNFALLTQVADSAEQLAAFRRYGRGSRHAFVSMPVIAAVRAYAAKHHYDLVHCGRLYIGEAALAVEARCRTLDLDEDDAWAWRRRAELQREAGEPQAADWSEVEAEAEDRLLARIGSNFAALFIAGDTDRARLAARHAGLKPEIVPNGVTFPAKPRHDDDGETLLFVGNLGYAPNVEGVVWFVHEVLPLVVAKRSVRLRIVGTGHSNAIEALRDHPRIDLVGAVDDVARAYETATLAIAPLHTGAGTRIKLIEAAAFEVPAIATSIAAQGLDFARDWMWSADDSGAFADAVLAALADPEERMRRARLARAAARPRHDRVQLVDALAQRFATMLRQSSGGHRSSVGARG